MPRARVAVVLGVLSALALSPLVAQAQTTVDSFTTLQGSVSDPPGGMSTAMTGGSDILGSRRDMEARLISVVGAVTGQVTGGALVFGVVDTTPDSTGELVVKWDGVSAPLNPTGLTPLDLAGGANALRLRVLSATAGTSVVIQVYTNGTNHSRRALVLPAVAATTDFYMSFTSFSVSGGTGANFGDVGAIVMTVSGKEASAMLDDLSAVSASSTLTGTLTDNVAAPAIPGQTLNYTATLANTGVGDATNVQLQATLPTSVSLGTVEVSPLARDDAYSIGRDTQLTVIAPGVLANDVDAEAVPDPLTAAPAGAIVTSQGGSVTLAANGGFTYNPPLGFLGADSFNYQADDGNLIPGPGTVVIDVVFPVNDPPALDAIADRAPIVEDAPQQTVNLTGITAGAGEGTQPLQVTAVSDNTALIPNPTLTYTSPDATGTLSYTPVAQASGTANVTVTVTDGGLDNNLATAADNGTTSDVFQVVVNAVNDPPTLDAIADRAPIVENASLQTVNLTGITAGAGEGTQPLQVTAVSDNTSVIPQPTVNYTSPAATGNLQYTPVAGTFGASNITVTLTDGGLDDNLATPGDNLTFSDVFQVVVFPANDVNPPNAVTLRSPPNGSTTTNSIPTFDWTDASDASGIAQYWIEIADDPGFSIGLFSAFPLLSTYTAGVLGDGVHYWRVSAQDGAGNWSAWSSTFSFAIETTPPSVPATLTQHDDAAGPAQPPGFVDDDTTVVFKATVSDPEGENVRLEVEVQPLGTSFLGVPTGTSGFQVGPATATVTLLGLTPSTQYHWQARTRDILGHVSAWVSFGGNPESAVDFTIP